jgi:carbonic anhydrase
VKYELRNIHYHTKSEHLLDGEQFDLEVHMVHESASGGLLVLGILVDVVGGTSRYGDGLVSMISEVKGRPSEYTPVSVEVSPAAFLPKSLSFATYAGSLTTPPCKEGVRWIVFTEKQVLGQEARQMFVGRKLEVGFHNFRPHFDATHAHGVSFSP